MSKPNRPCPKCREIGRDSKGDHLFEMRDGRTWTCMHATAYHAAYFEEKGREVALPSPQCNTGQSMGLPATVNTLTTKEEVDNRFSSVADRGISVETRRLYGVKTEMNPVSGDILRHYYPVCANGSLYTYKCREVATKDFHALDKMRGVEQDLFGIRTVKGIPSRLMLTEGEEDAMAAYEMLPSKFPVLGIPGSNRLDVVKSNLDVLKLVGTLYVCADNDSPGKELMTGVATILPGVRVVNLPLKDANAMLQAGRQAEFILAVEKAEKYRPPFLVRVGDVKVKAMTKPSWGREWPWPTLQRLTYGMRDGEGMFVGAGVKQGKSEWINELIAHRIKSGDGDKPAVIKFEEQPAITVQRVAGKIDGCIYHRPDVVVDEEQKGKTIDSMEDKMLMFKAFGSGRWEEVKQFIRYAVSEGSKTIIIDPITKLTNHLSSSETETELRKISDELACMAQDLGFFYIVTCHLKAPISGPPHERGGKVESIQFRGSRAMMENCFYMLGIERNKDPQLDKEVRNMSTFVLLEDRNFGNVGRFHVYYEESTGQYREPATQF